jgi:hypothetical protein
VAIRFRTKRNPQRGNSLILALIVMSALGTLSMLTVAGVRSGMKTGGNDRFHTIAMYAAESGGAAAMDYLRGVVDKTTGFTTILQSPELVEIVGNNQLPGDPENPFSPELDAYYRVEIANNRGDGGFATSVDTDKRVVIRATGYGPDGAAAVIEWDIQAVGGRVQRPCPVYAQKGQSEDNTGRNDCLGQIDTSQQSSFAP